ncbi:MAG TPA: lamin tail domain-containing protein, partial [Verrucomicrobiae bacterium]
MATPRANGSTLFLNFLAAALRIFLTVVLFAGIRVGAQNLTNGLACQWVADDFTNGQSWTDRIQGIKAVADGAPNPVTVAESFGTHNGVRRNNGTTGNGGFLIPGGEPPTGFTNYTIAVVFLATAGGPSGSSYYSDDIIFGYDISGVGQPDWGVSWGGSSSLIGQGVVAGIGQRYGDSGLQTGSTPLALNTTHAAVFQINGSNGTETLFVDGVQVGQNSGIGVLAPVNSNGNGQIPLLSNFNSTIATAFTGLLAEVRVYTNATVNGTALSAYLQNFYAQIPAVGLAATSPTAVSVGGTVNVQVSIPASTSQNGPFTVALTSSNVAVLASTNIVFPAGTTSANVSLPVLGIGSASLAASGTGLQSSAALTITGFPAGTIIPITWFKADAINGATNDAPLAIWNDSSGNGYNATQSTPSQDPIYVTNAMNGLPVVRFTSGSSTCMSFARPVQDDFTIICAFQSTQGLNAGTYYYDGAGLVNGEVPNVVDDFGTCLFANGSVAAGTGNPDVAVDSAPGYNDGKPHIMTFTRTESLGLVSLYMDGTLVGTTTGGTQSLTSPPVLELGAQQSLVYYLSGDIAEVQIYNSSLSGTNLQSVEGPLLQKYNIPPPAPSGLYLELANGQIVLNWTGSSGAVDYEILRATTAGGPYTVIATNSATTFTDTTASQTNNYYYEVEAVGSSGQVGTPTTAVSTSTILNTREPLGPSSRTTSIAISEIMWKPAPRTDGKNLEYVEIYNSNPWFQDISGYQLTCADMNYTFLAGTSIGSNSFIVVAAAPPDVESVYGITNVVGPYTGSLKHSETLELLDEQSNVLLTVPYTDVYPWPVATDATGHSLILSNPSYGEGDPRAWDISTFAGGSPGTADVYPNSPYKVEINEILPHSENPAVPQFIELYNHSGQSNDVSGCILTDDPTTNKFVIPPGTVMGPAGFSCFTQPQFGFTLNGQGETLYLMSPDGARILDAVQFGAQPDGVSYGRWPDGANDFYNFATNTPGTNNSSILIGDIVINELMYDPIS